MNTPRYFAEIIVGGASQQTQFTALPTQIITQQSGQLDLALFDADNQPFAIDNLASTDAEVVPFNTAEVPVTLGTGVVSFTGEVSNALKSQAIRWNPAPLGPVIRRTTLFSLSRMVKTTTGASSQSSARRSSQLG